ncbi:Uncharacterized iron-regulated membrane protein [Mesorhizobium albiziae]|uniref:Uncharacterized iron-regulated membrane protein n=1 Tax=Neomesorhizobium albiziae TaxID=335020 RepID=A0A1I4A452_9HYPH|nr:PepSY domain-containing protein [Mesorhizobium albiziae]GLS34020.1 hypothetical protein GCM10007937_57330 [Mesorhizobium albiziae]SFK50731.1 Uncharacterized iron-regulated membrane protein [Mesorhizobium albiziae]
MTDIIIGRTTTVAGNNNASDLYRAVWRWHFYAGLLVLPFLITLALTGALYLFRDEIDAVVHSDLKRVEVGTALAAPSAMIAAATAQYPGEAMKFTTPATPTASAEITVKQANGEKLAVYANPYTGAILGSLPDKGTIMYLIRDLHSLKFFGTIGRGAIEIAAGWAILLVGTGVYLWWPRKGRGGALSVRGRPRQRIFWRDLHAVTGIFVGGVILFLAATGMPWSVFWGDKVNAWANSSNFGYPSGFWTNIPMSDEHMNHQGETSWSTQHAMVPNSSGHAASAIGIDRAVAIFDGLEVANGYAVAIPNAPTDVYTASVFPDDVERQRIVHLDQYTGKPLIDLSYADFGAAAKALEWGISVHLGQQFGLANQLFLLAACMAIMALAVSAAVMWWKRRPSGSLGVPALPNDRSKLAGVIVILAVGGVIYPLVGASLVAMLCLDLAATRMWRTKAA